MPIVHEVPVFNIRKVKLSSSPCHQNMPVIGMGSMADPFDETALKEAVLEAIRVGYRHFDTALVTGTSTLPRFTGPRSPWEKL